MSNLEVVIVTGAASGIGAATAQVLARCGYGVAAADVVSSGAVVEEVALTGGEAVAVHLDVTDPNSWARVLADPWFSSRRLVGLVNNAGVAGTGGVLATTQEAWHRVHRVNLDGVFFGMRTVAPTLSAPEAAQS